MERFEPGIGEVQWKPGILLEDLRHWMTTRSTVTVSADHRPRSYQQKKRLTNILVSGFPDGQQHIEAVLFGGNRDHPEIHCLTLSKTRRRVRHEGRKNYLLITKLKFRAVASWFGILNPCPWHNGYDVWVFVSFWEHRTQRPLGTSITLS